MENTRKYALKSFALAAAVMALSLLPAVIMGNGVLTLRDDFNYQQIIFSIRESAFFKEGTLAGWSYTTDLGGDILTSYSFYGLTSPFTLVLALLPLSIIPYAIAPMIVLKVAVAALTAFYFIKRFVKKGDTAVLGALLYALSGYQTMNLMFPFYDATALFPLLLIALEEAVLSHKKPAEGEKKSVSGTFSYGLLAAACCLMSITNYFFFFGEIVFVVLYFLFRFVIWSDVLKNVKEKIIAAVHCLLEGLAGTLMSAFVLLPSAISVFSNPRVGTVGNGLVFDWTNYISIMQAYLFPADVMGTQRYFIEKGCTSCSVYLPLVGLAFVIAYIVSNKKSSLTWLIGVLAVFSVIPVLNSAFSMFNSQYYARWFFMLSMLLALATAIALDMTKPSIKKKHFITGATANVFIVTLLSLGLIALSVLLKAKNHPYHAKISQLFTNIYCLAAALFALAVLIIVMMNRKRSAIVKYITIGVMIVAIASNVLVSLRYKTGETLTNYGSTDFVNTDGPLSSAVTHEIVSDITAEKLGLPDAQNYRVNTVFANEGENYYAHSYDNLSLTIGVPSVNCFSSTVSGSIFEFYAGLGLDRRVTSYPPITDSAFLALTSCKYHLSAAKSDSLTKAGSYVHSDGTTIYTYEYEHFLPIGFVIDSYITPDEFESIPSPMRSFTLLHAVVSETGLSGLSHLSGEKLDALRTAGSYTDEELANITSALSENVASNFKRDASSFSAELTSTKDGWCFFSIPYSSGWTANVNDQTVRILNTNGVMAVPVTAGNNTISFSYKTPGLYEGLVISGISLLTVIGAAMFMKRHKHLSDNSKSA